MAEQNMKLPDLAFNSQTIRDEQDKLNLTDMWKAAGADPAKQPGNWRALPGTKEFVAYIVDTVIPGKSGDEAFRVVRGGREPTTWAHWQIGLAYAKYLSPEFHAWCNTVVRERMQGPRAPDMTGGFQVPTTMAQALRLAADQADTIERQAATIRQDAVTIADHVEHLDTLRPIARDYADFLAAEGVYSIHQAASHLGVKSDRWLFTKMREIGWTDHRPGYRNEPRAWVRTEGFVIVRSTKIQTGRMVPQMFVTTLGLAALQRAIRADEMMLYRRPASKSVTVSGHGNA